LFSKSKQPHHHQTKQSSKAQTNKQTKHYEINMADVEEEYAVENAPEETEADSAAAFPLPKPGDVLACDFRSAPAEPEGSGDIGEATTSAGAAAAESAKKTKNHIKARTH
jgi:hypothetical protein